MGFCSHKVQHGFRIFVADVPSRWMERQLHIGEYLSAAFHGRGRQGDESGYDALGIL